MYGVIETNNIQEFPSTLMPESAELFDIDELAYFTRIRLLTEPGYPGMDLSYAYGVSGDGTPCRVRLNEGRFGRKTYRSEIAALCKEQGMNANKLRVWDAGTYSIMYG